MRTRFGVIMTKVPEQLADSLDALYGALARYRPRNAIEHSPLKSHSIVEPLERKHLRELTADDLSGYSGSAVWTVGSSDDFKYFFPRIAELALHEEVGGSGWDSWATRLAPALTPSERAVAQRFFRTLWHTAIDSDGDIVQVDMLELLNALPAIFDDIEPLLSVFHPCVSRAAARHLNDICDRGLSYRAARRDRPPAIARWLTERAPSALYEALLKFP
jgi:hypothetical protein